MCRVMQQALNYINTSVSHAHSWKLIKVHMLQIIQVPLDLVFVGLLDSYLSEYIHFICIGYRLPPDVIQRVRRRAVGHGPLRVHQVRDDQGSVMKYGLSSHC